VHCGYREDRRIVFGGELSFYDRAECVSRYACGHDAEGPGRRTSLLGMDQDEHGFCSALGGQAPAGSEV